MIPIPLIAAFCGEAVVYILLCVLLWPLSLAGFPLGKILVALTLAYVLLRVMVVLLEFAMAWCWGVRKDRNVRLGIGGLLWMVLAEITAFLFAMGLLLPLSRRLVAVKRGVVTTTKRPPILLIHGFFVNAGVWAPMMHYLLQQGLANVFTIDLRPRFQELDVYAQQIAERVEKICEAARAQKVIIVAHSMGGLIARAYIQRFGGNERVEHLITIGSPHHGTRAAFFVPTPTTRQMRPGSSWLRTLNQDENQPGEVRLTSIYSVHDNIIIPHTSAELGQGKNIAVIGKGHFTLIFSREIGQLIVREITES